MILADTSVWIDHFRRGNPDLQWLLEAGEVAMHPMVAGELALGSLSQRTKTIEFLRNLPSVTPAADDLVMDSIERARLWSLGLGWIDVHLLAASRLAGVPLWTFDQRLARATRLRL